jgi:maltose/maltodextrin transport system substrate-binding protein
MRTALHAFVFLCLLCFGSEAVADGEGRLLIWINGDKAYTALQAIGNRFEAELGIPVKVEHPENPTDKFVSAARTGKGPDILIWAHDRLGEWADSGLLMPIHVYPEYMEDFNPKAWEAFTHNDRIWGYPIAMESVALIYNRALIEEPPGAFEEVMRIGPAYREQDQFAMLWDYKNTYFSWPILASADAYVFGRTAAGGYDPADVGVATTGAVDALSMINRMIQEDVMPRGVTYSVMEAKMNAGECAMMISGPWAWSNLEKSGIDYGVTTIPGLNGKPGRPFIGVLGAVLNRTSPNLMLAEEFLQHYVITRDGLRELNEDVPLGVPAYTPFYEELSVDPRIRNAMRNIEVGQLMPNIPQMGRFWTAMEAALSTVTDGQAEPGEALDNAARRIREE